MSTPDSPLARQVAAALVEEDGVDPESAHAAVVQAMQDAHPGEQGALGLYRAARQFLRCGHSDPPARLQTQEAPVRRSRPPPRGGTRKDTPAAKRRRR